VHQIHDDTPLLPWDGERDIEEVETVLLNYPRKNKENRTHGNHIYSSIQNAIKSQLPLNKTEPSVEKL
jgi:hypothetical protein